MKRAYSFNLLFLMVMLLIEHPSMAQSPICYNVDLDPIGHHEIIVSIEFPSLPEQPLTLHMPAASPGRYAVHHFAKNVYGEKAWDGVGNDLKVTRTNLSEWVIAGHDGSVTFQYTLFANHGDGTYSGIDNRKLHLNMPATFIYGVDMENRPIELTFDLSDYPDWKVATQLDPIAENRFWAPDYYYFFDSPTIVGDLDFRTWTVNSNGKDYTIEMAVMHEDSDETLDQYTDWVKAIVEEEMKLFGGLPDFDFGRYTFLMSYNPYIYGDGMEHRNSTICSASASLEQAGQYVIGTVAHEFIHAWNVERIRPRSLEPFDFDHANMSGELWFGEGFTSYYDDLVLKRAGIIDTERYLNGLSNTLNYVYLYPGRSLRNPIEMSYHAPFVDAASAIDEHNRNNTFISYYSYGAVLGLILDLQIREKFEQLTLDDFMKYVWEKFGKTEIPYEIKDLERALAKVTNDEAFARSFFEKHIYQSELPELEPLLKPYGIVVEPANPNQTHSATLEYASLNGGIQVTSDLLNGHPLYEAGLNKGDIILTIDGEKIENSDDLISLLNQIGQFEITYLQNGLEQKGILKTKQDPRFKLVLAEELEGQEKTNLEAWLGK